MGLRENAPSLERGVVGEEEFSFIAHIMAPYTSESSYIKQLADDSRKVQKGLHENSIYRIIEFI